MSHHSIDSLADGGTVVGCATARKVKPMINTICRFNSALLIDLFICCFPADSISLQPDAIEPLRVAGRDGVGGMKGSIRVEGIGEQHCPVDQRCGHVGPPHNDITAVLHTVLAAVNQTSSL